MLVDKVPGTALATAFRMVFMLRRGASRIAVLDAAQRIRDEESARQLREGRRRRGGAQRRNILFITSDQQRYDALGVNGGRVARTPALDALARAGLNYHRAHVHNVVCMPSRATMLTGQHPLTHGVVANGIPLPEEAPNVARHLREQAGYRTALIGKAHFEPHLDPTLSFFENHAAADGSNGPWRGFEHVELATHGPISGQHYADWLWRTRPDAVSGFGGVLTGRGGGDTGAPEVKHNPVPRELYHTDWVVDRAIAWLATLPGDEPWFCWLSFPDPHHPFDPPLDEVKRRIDWRDVPLPAGLPHGRDAIERILGQKPRHWLDWYRGAYRNPEGGPVSVVPAQLSDDQLREINAMIHVENELIDEAVAKIMRWLSDRGRDDVTDVLYTSDHGDLQGDFGLVFKGPYHTDALMRVPLVWRPAPLAGIAPASIDEPVGHVDLAPTFCRIAGVEPPAWMQGAALPCSASDRQLVVTTFDSQFARVGMHLRTIYKDGYILTRYLPSGVSPEGQPGGAFPFYWSIWGKNSRVPRYAGDEGELYDVRDDPHQWHNLWRDPARRALRDELSEALAHHLPAAGRPLAVAAPT